MKLLNKYINNGSAMYLVYDEKHPIDQINEDCKNIKFVSLQHQNEFLELMKVVHGSSYGFRKVCYFTIYNTPTNPTTFEFNSDFGYTDKQIRLILRKVSAAKRRLIKKWEKF